MPKCKLCGDVFVVPKGVSKKVYCSPGCQAEANRIRAREKYRARKENRDEEKPKHCLVCGAKLNGKQKMYCSKECSRKESMRRRAEGIVSKAPNKYICRRVKTCRYGMDLGGSFICGYILYTGHSRPSYPLQCEFYEERERRKGNADI